MRILIAGDSLTLPRPYRINSYDPHQESELAVKYSETYGSLIQRELCKLYPHKEIEVINRGQRGFTIKHILNQIHDHVYYFQPDVLILHVGIVDCWFREELNGRQFVNLNDFEKGVSEVVKIINSNDTTKLIIIGIAPTSLKMEERYKGLLEEIKKYNKILREQVDYNTIFFIDLENHIQPENPHKYLLMDDQHLNKEGNRLIFNDINNIICALIENQIGVECFQGSSSIKQALNHFNCSFAHYPFYLDNLYNILLLSLELKDIESINLILKTLEGIQINNHELIELIDYVKHNY
ncbi:GDSL-like lipase/acylhydrolase family protein [Bacillus oleivorans]|uniref:GDSL-like lipase/acylhydrolase family protein n=1 Tax=Bacillus oleivorans TaxID=1448271 RepID=A0A285CZ85_9BACI|nr:SGNH/GDSL hydrolase family protein [Bacillus oleivorans]SNX72874.1 GDSL-like lipase/acylhydrolase family protein [Bacillus oleivorans]